MRKRVETQQNRRKPRKQIDWLTEMVKLLAIKQWLQKRGLDPTGDRETCAKRLQEAMKIDQVGLPPALEPIGKLMQRLIKLLETKK